MQRRGDHRQAGLGGEPGQAAPDRLIGGDAARDDERARRDAGRRAAAQTGPRPVDQHIDDRGLEGGAEIGDVAVRERRDALRHQPHRRLQPREREIRVGPSLHRPREVEALGIALGRLALDRGATRIGQSEHLGDLVEGLADRVVDGAAELEVVADAAHGEQLRMPPRDEQQQIGKGEIVGQPRRQRMGFQMVDGDEGLARDERNRLGGGQANHDATDEAGTGGRRHRVDLARRQPRALIGAGDDTVDRIDMGARRDLGNDPAIGGMGCDLAQHLVGENLDLARALHRHDGGRGLVTSRLYAQNAHDRSMRSRQEDQSGSEGGRNRAGFPSYSPPAPRRPRGGQVQASGTRSASRHLDE